MVLCSKGRMASDVAAGVNFQATQYIAILYAAQVYIIKKNLHLYIFFLIATFT